MTLQKRGEGCLADGQQQNSSSKTTIKKTVENSGALQLILEMQDPIHTLQGAQKNTKHGYISLRTIPYSTIALSRSQWPRGVGLRLHWSQKQHNSQDRLQIGK